ncbi:MAG: hypothetical protein CMJ78_09520 [Planctomycetaceae bacterium]|nr:hypothetical protein [Planctomycetaceae bacterium]
MNHSPRIEFEAPAINKRDHWLILGASCLVFLLAALLTVLPEGRVAFKGFESHPLPHTCSLRMMINLDCAGCGLTRSTIHLVHGNFSAALAVHRLGWLVALLIASQVPYRLWIILRNSRYPLGKVAPWVVVIAVAVLLMVNWTVNMVRQFS